MTIYYYLESSITNIAVEGGRWYILRDSGRIMH